MTAILSNWLWLPKAEINTPVVKDALTRYPKKYRGQSPAIIQYEETETHLGVPRNWGMNCQWLRKFATEDRTTCPFMDFPQIHFPPGMNYKPGQKEAIDYATNRFSSGINGCLIEAGCGFGKSASSLAIASKMQTPTLVCINKTDLEINWRRDAETFFPGLRVGFVQQDKWDYKDKHVTVAIAQTLHSRLAELTPDFISHFGFVVFDEVHLFPAETFSRILNLFPARYRLGVSATFRRKDGLFEFTNWAISNNWHSVRVDTHPTKYYQLDWPTHLDDGSCMLYGKPQMSKYLEVITRTPTYNHWLIQQIERAFGTGRRILLVSERIEHLVNLQKMLDPSIDSGLYIGSLDGKKTSQSSLQETATKPVIFATYQMMSVGTNIPALDTIILATPRSDIEQVIGRVRRPMAGKKDALVVDPVWSTPYLRQMGRARKRHYDRLGIPAAK